MHPSSGGRRNPARRAETRALGVTLASNPELLRAEVLRPFGNPSSAASTACRECAAARDRFRLCRRRRDPWNPNRLGTSEVSASFNVADLHRFAMSANGIIQETFSGGTMTTRVPSRTPALPLCKSGRGAPGMAGSRCLTAAAAGGRGRSGPGSERRARWRACGRGRGRRPRCSSKAAR